MAGAELTCARISLPPRDLVDQLTSAKLQIIRNCHVDRRTTWRFGLRTRPRVPVMDFHFASSATRTKGPNTCAGRRCAGLAQGLRFRGCTLLHIRRGAELNPLDRDERFPSCYISWWPSTSPRCLGRSMG